MNRYKRMDKKQEEKRSICSLPGKHNKVNRSTKHSKGFTLVELIVVLVIIAILAGVAVPLMLGFVDNSREKEYILEAKIALSSSQAMLSDVYTDNLEYIPWYLRNQAFTNSGLDQDTEFIIWTKAKFDDKTNGADGTYKSIAAYTVDKALYRSKDGKYVYYESRTDTSKESWEVIDSPEEVLSYNESGELVSAGNLIVVWHSDSLFVKNDTASARNMADGSVVDPDSVTPEEEKKNVERFDKNKDGVDDGETGSGEITVTVSFIGKKNNAQTKNVVFFRKDSEVQKDKEFAFSSKLGFEKDVDYSNWMPRGEDENYNRCQFTWADKNYNSGSLTWTYSINPDYINDKENYDLLGIESVWSDSQVEKNLSSIVRYLKPDAKIILQADIDQNYYDVNLRFHAWNSDTQTVSVSGDDNNEVTLKYGKGEGDIHFEYTSGETVERKTSLEGISVEMSEKARSSGRDIRFTDDQIVQGKWLLGLWENNQTNYLEDRKTLDQISEWAKSYIEDLKQNNATKLAALQNNGIDIYACGNIYKTIYVSSTEGTQGTEKYHYNAAVFGVNKNSGLSEDNIDIDEDKKNFRLELSMTEYDEKKYIYKNVTDENNQKRLEVYKEIPDIESYSIFGIKDQDPASDSSDANDVITIDKGTNHVKYWSIYDCNKSTGAKVDDVEEVKTRNWDCSKQLLDELFDTTKDYDGVYAELDAMDFETLFEVYKDTAAEDLYKYIGLIPPVKKGLNSLIDNPNAAYNASLTSLLEIKYIAPPAKGDTSYRNGGDGYTFFKEVCLSETKIKTNPSNSKLLALDDDGNYIIDSFDPDYPAYTIGYSWKKNNKYKIFIFSDTVDTDQEVSAAQKSSEFSDKMIHCKGNMIGLFRGFESVSEFDIVSHLETSEVTSFMNWFKNDKSITSINLSNFDWSNVEVAESMFSTCTKLEKVIFSEGGIKKNSANLLDINEMFTGCTALKTADIDNLNTTNVTMMYRVLFNCKAFVGTKRDDSGNAVAAADNLLELRINSVTTLQQLLDGCSSLRSIKFVGGGLDEECPIGTMTGIYNNCGSLDYISINNLLLSDANFKAFFSGRSSGVKKIEIINSKKTGDKQSFKQQFQNYNALTDVKMDIICLSNVSNMSFMFDGCTKLASIDFTTGTSPISSADSGSINNVNNTEKMFNNCYALSSLNLSFLDTNNVTNFKNMFGAANTSNLRTIYASDAFVVGDGYKNQDMFGSGLINLVGGGPTNFDVTVANYTKASFAHIGTADNPGYFTALSTGE